MTDNGREPIAENFLQDFGPSSGIFRFASSVWLEAIAALRKQCDYQATYRTWRKALRIAYGTSAGDEGLFVRHTYLAALAKLITYLRITGVEAAPDMAQTSEIMLGTFFEKQRIVNFLEEDFSSWVARPLALTGTQEVTGRMARLLFTYRLSDLSEDVLKELYQALVDPKDRHDLGEYYTPDWLAARMCNALLSESGEEAVLDPACGSGTFLYQVIRHKKRRLPPTGQALAQILATVVGVDIHPLAVLVSKMNVLLSLGDLLQQRSGPVFVQVYRANSIRPESLPRAPFTSGERADRASPLFSPNQFDTVIGNPPWLSFRFIEKGDYQDYLKNLLVKELGLLEGAGHLIAHLELATLFFARCSALYLKRSGKIGFVLPRSIFTADQHDRFRRSGGTGDLALTRVWDLQEVSPLFSVPAAVAFGDRSGGASTSLPGEILRGRLKRKNASWAEAEKDLRTEAAEFHVIQQGQRSFLSTGGQRISSRRSDYHRHFKEGATLVPRSFWFVEFKRIPGHGPDVSQPVVATDPRAQAEAKPPYEGIHFEAAVEAEFLYATLLSTDLLPFGHLDFRPVVLPLLEGAGKYRLVNSADARALGYVKLAEWLERVEAIWEEMRKEKAKNSNALGWLNYRGKLTGQDPNAKHLVLYSRSATFLCAAAVQSSALSPGVRMARSSPLRPAARRGDREISLRHFVAGDATYYFETDRAEEARYLVAVLNSPTVDALIKPMQARGLWGPRDIHKKVWELPIPRFNPQDKAHLRLAALAKRCAEKVKAMLPGLRKRFAQVRGRHAIGRARTAVREALKAELAEIDALVKETLR